MTHVRKIRITTKHNKHCVVILFRSEMCYINISKIIQGGNF